MGYPIELQHHNESMVHTTKKIYKWHFAFVVKQCKMVIKGHESQSVVWFVSFSASREMPVERN
jgi:hypothetical protein